MTQSFQPVRIKRSITQLGAFGAASILCVASIIGLSACGSGHQPLAGQQASALAASSQRRPYTELDSSVVTVGDGDWSSNRCVDMVDRAATFKQSRIMFVPTLFWVQYGNGPVDHYCYDRHSDAHGNFICEPADAGKIARFKAALQRCFQRAVDANLSIALTPHLDDGLAQGRWRNTLDFDPLTKYNGYSYDDVVLTPLAEAMNAVAKPETKLYFGMQGEMSVTVFKHPARWRSIVEHLREQLTAGKAPSYKQQVQIGISTNFNKLTGVGIDIIDPAEYVRRYPELWQQVKWQFDLTEIRRLLESIDYIGMSSYPSLYPGFPTSDIEGAISQFDFEFSFFGITVNDLIAMGKKIHFSEYGLGGGTSQFGNVKATDAAGAAKYPFFGIFQQYSKATDPWVLYDLNRPSVVRDYQQYFYAKTLEYLSNARHYRYQIDAAFLWNQGSWDVQAIYPESSSWEGSYRSPTIVEMIRKHNEAAMRGDTAPAMCTDEPPPGSRYSCEQQARWGKCSEPFMQGFCDRSCGKC